MSIPEKDQTCFLPVRLDVRVEDNDYRAIVDDIKRFRSACRQSFCMMMMAYIAGAKIEEHANGLRVTPDNERAKFILSNTMDMSVHQRTKPAVSKALKTVAAILGSLPEREKLSDAMTKKLDDMLQSLTDAATRHNWAEDISIQGAASTYEIRDWVLKDLLFGWEPFCFDSLRRECVSIFHAKDPEHEKATRGWLMLQGARKLSFFSRIGIEFPIITGAHKFGSNSITLKWLKDKEYAFKILQMDPARWQGWTDARDGRYPLGSLLLYERDGRLRITIPIQRTGHTHGLNPSRTAVAVVENGTIRTIAHGHVDIVRIDAAVFQMLRLKKQSDHFDQAKRPTGSPVKKWGAKQAFRSEADRLYRITLRRTDAQKDWNHRWTRRIVDVAIRSGCKSISLKLPEKAELKNNIPWSWSQFRNFMEYKCKLAGIAITE